MEKGGSIAQRVQKEKKEKKVSESGGALPTLILHSLMLPTASGKGGGKKRGKGNRKCRLEKEDRPSRTRHFSYVRQN